MQPVPGVGRRAFDAIQECRLQTVWGLTAGFLLEVVAVLSGIGITVKSANVRTCAECTEDPTVQKILSHEDAQSVKNARIMQFEATEDSGGPLSERSVQAVLFTLGLVSGPTRHGDTVVPSLRSYATKYLD